jgi:hypothetical protein
VAHLGALDGPAGEGREAFRAAQERGYYSVLAVGRDLAEGELVVVTRGMRAVRDDEAPEAEQATLAGLLKVLGQENVSLRARSVDLDAAGPPEEVAERLALECTRGGERVAAWRGGQRWAEGYAPARLEHQAAFRARGVYLITGGFGPVGLALAEHLARRCRARLVLLGRRGAAGRAEDVGRLEALGAEVLALACDVAEADQMRAALAQVRERFGALHGVVHAAGVSEATPLGQLTPERVEPHFRAKAEGLYVLEELLAGAPALDFCVVFSSLAAVLGGLGFAAA